jgi:hypothetical protein
VHRDRDASAGRCDHRETGNLRRAHDRRHVVLGEDPLDRDHVRGVRVHPGVELVGDLQQPRVDGRRGRRHGDADGDQARAAPGHGVDDADAAAGQAGVDSEDAHAWRQSSFSSSAMTSSEASKFA